MKHHNTLTDDQIHNAKGFEPARKRSVSAKDKNSNVEWVNANYLTNVIVTTRESVAEDLHHRFFCLYNDFDEKKYAVYIDLNGGDALALPATYDEVIRVDCTDGGTAGEYNYASKSHVGHKLQIVLDAHADFSSTDDNDGVVSITGIKSPTPSKDVDTGFVFSNQDTEVVDEVLTTDSNGNMKWVEKSTFSSEIEDVEGTEVKSTGETGGTKFLREDGDGTCSWQTVSGGGSGDITQVSYRGDTGLKTFLSGSADITIEGDTGLTTTIISDTLTISLDEIPKSKGDIDSLTGVIGTDLGTFTGSTISDSRDIKGALQDLETDHEVEKGTSYHFNSFRWSSYNLNGTTNTGGTNNGWVFYEPNNNKDMMFATACDTSDMSYQVAMKGCIETPITGVTSKLVGGSCLSSGEPSDAYRITIWKAGMHGGSGGSGLSMTLMGTFAIDGSNNTEPILDSLVLGSDADCTLVDGDGVVVVMEDIETYTDHDTRGTVTLRFEDTF